MSAWPNTIPEDLHGQLEQVLIGRNEASSLDVVKSILIWLRKYGIEAPDFDILQRGISDKLSGRSLVAPQDVWGVAQEWLEGSAIDAPENLPVLRANEEFCLIGVLHAKIARHILGPFRGGRGLRRRPVNFGFSKSCDCGNVGLHFPARQTLITGATVGAVDRDFPTVLKYDRVLAAIAGNQSIDGSAILALGVLPGNPVKSTRKAYKSALTRAGLPGIHIRQIRHTVAVRMLAAGKLIEMVSQYLGHSNTQITYKTCPRFIPEHMADAAEIVNFDLLRPKSA